MTEHVKIDDRPRLLGELAAYYDVSVRTMKKWLQCGALSHIKPTGYYYSIKQVQVIVEHLGRND